MGVGLPRAQGVSVRRSSAHETARAVSSRRDDAHPCLVKLATALRRLGDQDLEETVSTRLLVVAARLIVAGLPERTACRAAIVDALTDDFDTAAALDEVVQAVLAPDA